MSSDWPLFQRSVAALALVKNGGGTAECEPRAWAFDAGRRFEGGRSTAMSIPFAPESDPTANIIELGEDETAGPLPLGFEFEFFGRRYAWFNMSSRGLLSFSTDSYGCYESGSRDRFDGKRQTPRNFIKLGWADVHRLGRKRVAYEVRGPVQRRRLVLSFAAPGAVGIGGQPMAAQVVLHERTGMVDLHNTGHDGAAFHRALRLTTSPGDTWRRHGSG
jgi:hypothetical protein